MTQEKETAPVPVPLALSAAQAAQVLGMSKHSLDAARATGELFGMEPPRFIKYGRAIRYPVNELVDWMSRLPLHTTNAEALQD
jgi:predicted DNA-binding transcriptional regulator AlpA